MSGREPEELERRIRRAVEEDVGGGDVTTLWTVPPERTGTGVVVAKAPLVLAGGEVAERVFREVDGGVEVARLRADGTAVERDEAVLRVRGPARGILTGERTALNFLGRLSGIATLTRAFVDAVAGTGARIVDTRKTTPGWRDLEKAAVRAGGGTNHRMGLWDMVLIKDNHVAAAGGIRQAVERVRSADPRGLTVEVEVRTLEELEEALGLGVDRLLLDNMDPRTLRAAVERTRAVGPSAPELEASGNVSLDTVREVAETGVEWISVGALTHSAPTADLSLRLDGA